MEKLPSGSDAINNLLMGGYETDIITTIYGPGGSGKTNLCILAAISCVNQGKKAIYVDTEGGFSTERLNQICNNSKDILRNIFFLRPTTFTGQKKAFIKLKDLEQESIGLIIIDTIAMLYRLELGKSNKVYDINKELGNQISHLSQISRKNGIPVIITNQVYSAMDETENVVMVGGDFLKYQSKCLIELKKLHAGQRIAILRKHRSLAEERSERFKITQEGIELCQDL